MLLQQNEWLLLQPFREPIVTTMEHSITLATMVTGGVLQSTFSVAPGFGTCSPITAM